MGPVRSRAEHPAPLATGKNCIQLAAFLPIVSKSYRIIRAIFVALYQTFRLRSVRTSGIKIRPTRNWPSDGASVFRSARLGTFERFRIFFKNKKNILSPRHFEEIQSESSGSRLSFSFSLLFKWIWILNWIRNWLFKWFKCWSSIKWPCANYPRKINFDLIKNALKKFPSISVVGSQQVPVLLRFTCFRCLFIYLRFSNGIFFLICFPLRIPREKCADFFHSTCCSSSTFKPDTLGVHAF